MTPAQAEGLKKAQAAAKAKRDSERADPATHRLLTDRLNEAQEASEKNHSVKSPEQPWRGMVLLTDKHGSWWARVAIPAEELDRYLVGKVEAPDMRGIVVGKIGKELSSDDFILGRGW